jgi:hypothetical protein
MADALTSWHDTAVKSAIVDFVARITTEGGAHHVPPSIASPPVASRRADFIKLQRCQLRTSSSAARTTRSG